MDDGEEEDQVVVEEEKGEQEQKSEDGAPPYQVLQLPTEPEPGEGVTRIRIRSAEGKQLLRRFNLIDPVGFLYKFIQEQVSLTN